MSGCDRMRMRGIEPPRGCPHTDLNRARLPVPPHPRGALVAQSSCAGRAGRTIRWLESPQATIADRSPPPQRSSFSRSSRFRAVGLAAGRDGARGPRVEVIVEPRRAAAGAPGADGACRPPPAASPGRPSRPSSASSDASRAGSCAGFPAPRSAGGTGSSSPASPCRCPGDELDGSQRYPGSSASTRASATGRCTSGSGPAGERVEVRPGSR